MNLSGGCCGSGFKPIIRGERMKRLISWVLVLSGAMVAQQVANAAAANNETDSAEGRFWGGVGLKYWSAAYNPSENFGASQIGNKSLNFAVGYDRFFYTATLSGFGNLNGAVSGSNYPAGGIQYMEQAFGLGYNFNSNVAIVAGLKTFLELYPGNTVQHEVKYNTIAGVFNYPLTDSKIVLMGNVAIGRGSSALVIQAQNSYDYMGYELGASYPIFESTKVIAAYKSESMGLPYGAAGLKGTATKSGPMVGVTYSF